MEALWAVGASDFHICSKRSCRMFFFSNCRCYAPGFRIILMEASLSFIG